jgi:hypothetical protein
MRSNYSSAINSLALAVVIPAEENTCNFRINQPTKVAYTDCAHKDNYFH